MNSIITDDIKMIVNSDVDWYRFEGKTILISGANGFLPAYMVETLLYLNRHLLKVGCTVIGLVRNLELAKLRFKSHVTDSALMLVEHDIIDPINLEVDVDFIIHAASLASPKYYSTDPIGVILPNVYGTKNMLDLAEQKQIEAFLYFSSSEVYGNINLPIISEFDYGVVDPLHIRSCYAESKRMGETMCISYYHHFGINVKIVRPFHTYGPGMKLDDGRVFADFINNIVNYSDIELKSDGLAERQFCYIADATIAFFKVLLIGEPANAYNVANVLQNITIKELANTLVSLFPERKLNVVSVDPPSSYISSNVISQRADISKIEKLGWHPVITIEEGFAKTVRSYENS